MKNPVILTLTAILCFGACLTCDAAQTIIAQKVDKAPAIDGAAIDPVWEKANAIVTHDETAGIDMTLKTVYTDGEIFFLVSFPDPEASVTHKSWVWDKATEMYKVGPDREDTFVFKWNMEPGPVDLSVKSDNPYTTDIWFWKACRTNPVGYADDKYDRLNTMEMPKSYKVVSKTGKNMYLIRDPDSGTSAFTETLPADYKGDKIPNYTYSTPTGSQADVKAKGIWSDGKWTIEFERALNTGHADDVQFDTSKTYLFGVSRHEIAGRPPDPKAEQPLYGAGDVGEALTLQFGK